MRLSLNWLQEEFGLVASAQQLAKRLTMAGLEVDAVLAAALEFSNVVVGRVVALKAHEQADKLKVAMVEVGQSEPLQIVCGAANVAVGICVPTALVGAVLPSGEDKPLKIKRSKLRGVESFGMLCSARELGLSEASDGLMILPEDAPVGQDVREYLQLDDTILEIDLTPNRADAFSMRGLAREIGVLFNQVPDLQASEACFEGGALGDLPACDLQLSVQAQKACPIYYARLIEGVDASVKSPLWLAERLRRAGVRSHDLLVDVTNYVMLSLGTPMHAFDGDAVQGGLEVRFARKGERLTLLNAQQAVLDESVLIIADEQKPLAIAGVMGGAQSACSPKTRRVILESAWFDPVCVAGKARRFGLSSDAAQRFERGVDGTLQRQALDMATRLIVQIAGGQAQEAVSVVAQGHEALAREPIMLYPAQITRLIGRSYPPETVERILRALGCVVQAEGEGWQVTPPSWRFDLTIAEDLIEEVVRVEGYEAIEAVMPTFSYREGLAKKSMQQRWAEQLLALGFQEAITYSFIDAGTHAVFFPEQEALALTNPISAQLSTMRVSLLPSLVQTVMHNRHRQQLDVRLFEIGRVFIVQGEKAQDCVQENRLAGALAGLAAPEQWGVATRKLDFYDAKAVVERLLAGVENVDYRPSAQAYLHTGQSADIYCDGRYVGVVGALHPSVQQALGIKGAPIWLFELSLEAGVEIKRHAYQSVSKFPSVRRDLALVVDEAIQAQEVQRAIVSELGEWLDEVFWFDLYQGENLPAGKKSLAVAILLQGQDKTLQDEEVERMIAALVETLKEKFGAKLRN